MSAETVHTDHHPGGVAVLTMDRPPVNALNASVLQAMDRALADLEGQPEVRAVVITGAGKTFSAGMDLKEVQTFTVDDQTAMVEGLNRLLPRLYGFAKPVIAAVNGHAIAGGLLVMLGSDFRVAAAGALLGLAEVRAGVRFPLAGLEIVRAELAPGVCRRMVLSGMNVAADAAERMGVVDEVVEPGQVMDRARAVAEDFARIPPQTFAAVKAQLRAETLERIAHASARRLDPLLRGWFTDETRDAARAILAAQKR